jgi:MoaA/NifB/PqqE/SkfB family radical SAM enzyme
MFEKEIAQWVAGWREGETGPFQIQFNPTNKCNLRCRFCWLRDFDDAPLNYEEIPTSRYLEIINEASDLGVHSIEITGGGEPMLRKDIFELMKEIKKEGIFGRLVTNGTLFTPKLIKSIIRLGWDEIVFSLDAPEKKVNDYLRGKSFEKIVTAIRTFQLLKLEWEKKKPLVHIHMVLCNKNFHLLPQMFEFAHDLNCRNLLVEPIVLLATRTKAGEELLFDKSNEKPLLKMLRKAAEIAHKHGFQTNVDKLELELIRSVTKMQKVLQREGKGKGFLAIACYQPFYQMIIRPWGVAGPCCMFDNVGDNIKEKSLREIWFGHFFREVRKKLLARNLPSFCHKCNPSKVQENRKIRIELEKLS